MGEKPELAAPCARSHWRIEKVLPVPVAPKQGLGSASPPSTPLRESGDGGGGSAFRYVGRLKIESPLPRGNQRSLEKWGQCSVYGGSGHTAAHQGHGPGRAHIPKKPSSRRSEPPQNAVHQGTENGADQPDS